MKWTGKLLYGCESGVGQVAEVGGFNSVYLADGRYATEGTGNEQKSRVRVPEKISTRRADGSRGKDVCFRRTTCRRCSAKM